MKHLPVKYLILSTSRTGSSYFTQALHLFLPASTKIFAEPFRELLENDNMFKVIENTESVVLKTHLTQLEDLSSKQIDYFLHGSWYIILLMRKNIFDCAFSAVVANTINNYNDKKYLPISLRIQKNIFFEIVDNKIRDWETFAELKQKNLYNKIIYFEDLSFDSKKDAQLILKNTKTQKRTNKAIHKIQKT